MKGIVVLISGRGSNLDAICNAGLTSEIKCVISNNANAPGLEKAANKNIPTCILDHKKFKSREDFDSELFGIINNYTPELIVLAGFMRILTTKFVNHFQNRMINIHPSLLPSFTGFDAQKQALDAKVKVTGATVHFVTPELDHGPIIVQGVTKVCPNDTKEDLSNRVLELEHIIYPFAIQKILQRQVEIIQNSVKVIHDENDLKILGKFYQHIYY